MKCYSAAALASLMAAGSLLSVAPTVASTITPDFIVPDSSISHPGDAGRQMHTNYVISRHMMPEFSPDTVPGTVTPSELHSVYNIPSGGSGTIALVDAYDYPSALSDFNAYSAAAGIPQETSTNVTSSSNQVFQVVYGSGTKPAGNSDWNVEEALDIEIAHAMAPNAKIVLVEGSSASDTGLYTAVKTAAALPGIKEISMSWSGSEYSGETSDDKTYFSAPGVLYFASSGDDGKGVGYPASSPGVVGVGGTTLTLKSGAFSSEKGWADSGGGPSTIEALPSYQKGVKNVGTKRSVPDISADANPNTGIGVYEDGSWEQVGGTSLSCPMCAGMVNDAASGAASGLAELTTIYANLGTSNFRDITSGNNGYACHVGYDYVTGVGRPNGTGAL